MLPPVASAFGMLPEQEKIREIVAAQLRMEGVELLPEMTFDELELDSLAVLELIMALEEEFDISINDEEFSSTANLGEMSEMILAKMGIE